MTGLNIIDPGRLLSWNVGYRPKTTGIVLHHAEANGCTVYDINRWHKGNGWAGIGYHFYVRKDGSVYAGRGIDRVGAHAGANPSKPAYKYENWANRETVGICAEGRYQTETMPEVQKQAIVRLCRYVIEKYPTVTRIYRHSDISATDCPGDKFPFDEIVSEVWKKEPERGRFDAADARYALRAAAGLEDYKAVYDLNGDGRITADEAREALREAAKLK